MSSTLDGHLSRRTYYNNGQGFSCYTQNLPYSFEVGFNDNKITHAVFTQDQLIFYVTRPDRATSNSLDNLLSLSDLFNEMIEYGKLDLEVVDNLCFRQLKYKDYHKHLTIFPQDEAHLHLVKRGGFNRTEVVKVILFMKQTAIGLISSKG